MINLIPIQLDKATGRIFARGFNVTGGTFQVTGFSFTQATDSAIWNINHNGSTTFVMVQIFDENDEEILPDTTVINDANNLTITFSDVQAGTALLLLFTPTT